MHQKWFLVLCALVLNSQVASAGFEVRGNAGGSFIEPVDLNKSLKNQGIKEIYVFGELGADALLIFPPGFGFGVRYGYGGIKVDGVANGSGYEAEVQASRWAGVVTVRGSIENFYLGLIGTVGFNHSSNISVKTASKREFNDAKVGSYSVGVEMGTKIGPLRIGTEGGLQNYQLKEVRGPTGPADFNVNLNGPYAMGHLGVGF